MLRSRSPVLMHALILLLVFFNPLVVLAENNNVPGTDSTGTSIGQVLSTASPRVVLKNGNTLLVLDQSGMIDARTGSPYGLFEDDTRFLSRWQLKVNGKDPTLITSFYKGGYHGSFLYSIKDELLIQRDLVLLKGLNERIKVQNYGTRPVHLIFSMLHGCDFKDMFEVRGQKRQKAGESLGYWIEGQSSNRSLIHFKYRGLDKREYLSYISSTQKTSHIDEHSMDYEFELQPHESKNIELRVDTSNTPETHKALESYETARNQADAAYQEWKKDVPEFKTDWEALDKMLRQSLTDLYLLRQNTAYGPCLAAGLPWFATAFGRDQCVTALETLPFMPDLSRDLLKVLAAYQGKKHDSFTEEEEGRIMHELRLGEMAQLREIAFVPYYGTVDATPLWLMLLSRYVDATGDLDLARSLWPNVEAALSYLDKSANKNDGFLYYGGKDGAALSNQGWKDSADSVMHKNGDLASAPIALCEVQGYMYDALCGAASMAEKLGKKDMAAALLKKSAKVKDQFKTSFWSDTEHFVALALDGTGKPCQVVSSNPGHLLSTGIIDDSMAASICDRLMQDDMFSGWGIRTLSTKEKRYNPLSYHNGSVWPHDNAIIAEGLAARGRADSASRVLESLVESAQGASDDRLPELFCGFPRSDYDTPVPYAVSCVPQAWAAGSLLQILRSVLGIKLVDNKIVVSHPKLPPAINKVTISNLRSGAQKVSLNFERNRSNGDVKVSSSSNAVKIEN